MVNVDVESKHVLNAMPYFGKDKAGQATQRLFESVVIKIVEPYLGKGRNVTTDILFTSTRLATHLLKAKLLHITVIRCFRQVYSTLGNNRPYVYFQANISEYKLKFNA